MILPYTRRDSLQIALSTLYSNQRDAAEAGAPRFFTGRLCKNGHQSDRYTSGGACVECMMSRGKPSGAVKTKRINLREQARLAGEKFYDSRKPCAAGHTSPRYVSSGACVACCRRELSSVELPVCLQTAIPNCPKCERFSTCSRHDGSSQFSRACEYWPDWPGTLGRTEAVRRGMQIYRPADPCPVCGKRSWRRIGRVGKYGARCSECLAAANAARGGVR